jgi:hypothetical protein
MMNKQIVGVQFESKYHTGEFSGHEYSYEADTALNLKPGDLVKVPTQRGDGLAKVSRINVKESEVDERYFPLKVISERVDDAPADVRSEATF